MEYKQIACIYFWYVYRMIDNAWEKTDVQRGSTTIFLSFFRFFFHCYYNLSSFFFFLFLFYLFYFFFTFS